MKEDPPYDWAAAIAAILSTNSNDFRDLATAAQLDPIAGDLSDADFSGLDLSGQNLSGWDLSNAKFSNARLTKTELRAAIVSPDELIEAIDWERANLDDDVRAAATEAAARKLSKLSEPMQSIDWSVRTFKCLQSNQIKYLGDLVQKSEAEMLRIENFGRKSLAEVKEMLAQYGLHLGMEVTEKY